MLETVALNLTPAEVEIVLKACLHAKLMTGAPQKELHNILGKLERAQNEAREKV